MIKPYKMIDAGSHGFKSKTPRLSIGLEGLNFSRRIASKYGTFYRSDSMPILIFRKFFGIKYNNSSHCRLCNNSQSILKFNYFINAPLQKTLSFFSNFVTSIKDVYTCTKTRTSMIYYNPLLVYQYIHQHFYAESSEKTNTDLCPQKRFIQNTTHEKIISNQIKKVDKQFIDVLHRLPSIKNILTSEITVVPSYLQRTFNFDTSTNLNAANEGLDTPNGVYTPLILSLKLKILDYSHYKSMETAISDPNWMISTAKKVNRPSVKYGGSESIVMPFFRQTMSLNDNRYVTLEDIEKEKRQFIQKLHQASIFSKTLLTFANPVIRSYLHREYVEASTFKNDAKMPVVRRVKKPSKRKHEDSEVVEKVSLRQTEVLKDNGNNTPLNLGEWEKQFVPLFHQPSLYTRSIMTPITPEQCCYLQKTFSPEFAGFKPARISVKTKKTGTDPVSIPPVTKIVDTLSFKKTNTQYEINVEQIREAKKQLIHILHQLPSYKTELKQLRGRIKQRQVFHIHCSSGNLKFSDSVFLVQLLKSYKGNTLTSVNLAELSYLRKIFNFDISPNINAVAKSVYTPPILSLKSEILDYLRYKSIERAISDPNWIISIAKKVEGSSTKSEVFQGINIPSPRQTKALKENKNTALGQIGKEKEKFIQKLHRESIFSKTVLTLVNPLIRRYLHKNDIDVFISKISPEVPVVRTAGKPSKRKYEDFETLEKSLLSQTRTLKDNGSIALEHIEKWEKQFMSVILRPPSLYTRNTLKSKIPVTFSYLQETFNFKFDGLKPGWTAVSAKRLNIKSKIITAFTRDTDALSYQQTRNIQNMQYEDVFNHGTRPGKGYLFSSINNIKTLKDNINNSFHNSFFSVPLMNLKSFDHIIKKNRSPEVSIDIVSNSEELVLKNLKQFNRITKKGRPSEVDTDIVSNSGELILKKPSLQKTEVFSENERNIHTQNLSSTEISEDSGKYLFKEKKMHEHEIGVIADRVYKMIEKRISIEKDRRGLF